MITERADFGTLTNYPSRISPAELQVGDVVVMAVKCHMVMQVDLLDDPRWVARVVWDDGETTLYSGRVGVQRAVLTEEQRIRNAEQVLAASR